MKFSKYDGLTPAQTLSVGLCPRALTFLVFLGKMHISLVFPYDFPYNTVEKDGENTMGRFLKR